MGTKKKKKKREREKKKVGELKSHKFMPVSEACKAIIWPTPGFKKRAFESTGFSAERILFNFRVHRTPQSERIRS